MPKYFMIVVLLIGINHKFYSQIEPPKDTIYLDENSIEITSSLFDKKMKVGVFHSSIYITKSLAIKKILHKFYFGKLTKQECNQLRLLLMRESNSKINKDANLVINFRDTLHGYPIQKRNYDNHIKKHKTRGKGKFAPKVKHNPFNQKIFSKNVKRSAKHLNKCSKKILKWNNSYVFNVFNINEGYPIENEYFKWVKDPGIFKMKFFNIMYENNLLIIKSNGDYFLKFGHFSDKSLNKLLKSSDWSQYKKDWKKSIKSNSKNGYGIIAYFNRNTINHVKHCF